MRKVKTYSTGETPVPPALMPYAKLKVMGGRLAESLKNKIKLFLSSSMDTPISKVFYRIPREAGGTGVRRCYYSINNNLM
jgi:hypothetical protein